MRGNKVLINLSLLLILLYSGCGVQDNLKENSQDEDRQELNFLASEIYNIIGDALSNDPADCRMIAFGSKPCGGPLGYLVYSINDTDTLLLVAKVELYNLKQEAHNNKWGINSDCMFVGPPDSLICEDGHCVAVY